MRSSASIDYRTLAIVAVTALLAACETETEPPAEPVTENQTSESRWSWPIDSAAADLDLEHIGSQVSGAIGDLAAALTGAPVTDLVPAEELKALLSSKIGRYKTDGTEMMDSTVASFGVVSVTGVMSLYGSEDEGVTIGISDWAQIGTGFGFEMPFFSRDGTDMDFAPRRFDELGDVEYPYFEEFGEEGGEHSCKVVVWAEKRFLVGIGGKAVPMELCGTARESFPFDQLRRLAQKYAPEEVGN